MKRYVWTCLVLALGLAGSAFAPAALAAPRAKFGPKIAALIAEAKHEGRLQLSWSAAGFGDAGKDIPEWIAGFNKFYGLHLPYTFTPAPTMTQQVAAVVQSAQSHTPAATDVVILGSDNLLTAISANATQIYNWQALAKEIGVDLPSEAVAIKNSGVAFSTAVFGIEYNKNAISPAEAPQTLANVLNPKWKGRVAAEPHAAGFNLLAAFDPKWPPAKTVAYVRRLARQIGGLMRCAGPGPLLSGQFDMMVLECDIASAIRDERRGVPIGYVVPKDAPLTDPWYMVVPRKAPDPAAGALLALFMLTKQGQALSWKSDGGDLALLPGSHTAALFGGMPATNVDIQDYAKHPEAVKYSVQYTKILTGMAHR